MELTLTHENLKDVIKLAISEALNSKSESKATLTIQECVSFTGIGRDKLMELAHNPNSDFPCFKVGSKTLINRELLVIWLNKVTQEGRTL